MPILHILIIRSYFKLSRGTIEDLTCLLSGLSGTPVITQVTCEWIDIGPLQSDVTQAGIRIEDLTDSLTEDPDDTPAMLIPTIELHIALLQKAHRIHEATLHILGKNIVLEPMIVGI